MKTTFKLTIEMVPAPCWGNSMCNLLPRSRWDKIRKETYKKYNYTCAFCGVQGMMHCHEIWRYEIEDGRGIQHLDGFVPLCPTCHNIKHLGRSSNLAKQGKLDYDALIKHFCSVNNCTEEDFHKYDKACTEEWKERSDLEWETDFGEWGVYVPADKIKGYYE